MNRVHIATEVLQILNSEQQACCFMIKVWLVTLTDENVLAGNRQHVQEVVTYMPPVEAFVTRIKIFDRQKYVQLLDRFL